MSNHWTTSVSFRLGGDTLDPDEWSEYFGIQPEESGKKGNIRKSGNKEHEIKTGGMVYLYKR
jgi:hypothetical protein